MNRVLHVFRDAALDGPTNMARDEGLLHDAATRPAVLRLYAWTPPTISLGYFQRYADLRRLPPELQELPVVRRLTGGGAILHDREITYSLVLDHTVSIAARAPADLYRLVHDCWRAVLAADGLTADMAPDHFPLPTPRGGPFFCFERPGRTDLIFGGRKLLGSAQRRLPGAVLQHGSLMLGQRFAGHPGASLADPDDARVHAWGAAFAARLARALALTEHPATWSAAQLANVAVRREQYAGDAWTRRR